MAYNLQKHWLTMLYTWNQHTTVNQLYFKRRWLGCVKQWFPEGKAVAGCLRGWRESRSWFWLEWLRGGRWGDRGGQPIWSLEGAWILRRAPWAWGAQAHVHSVCLQTEKRSPDAEEHSNAGERWGSHLAEEARGVPRSGEITRERETPWQHAPEHTNP